MSARHSVCGSHPSSGCCRIIPLVDEGAKYQVDDMVQRFEINEDELAELEELDRQHDRFEIRGIGADEEQEDK